MVRGIKYWVMPLKNFHWVANGLMNSIMKVQNLHCLNDVHLFKYVYCLHMVDCVCVFCVCVFKGGGGGREGWVSFLWKGKEAAAAKAMLPSSVVYADTPILVDFF